jgi:hypothetical protein
VPQEPAENFNLMMSDIILRCMPKLPLHSAEVKTIHQRAAVGVLPQSLPSELAKAA